MREGTYLGMCPRTEVKNTLFTSASLDLSLSSARFLKTVRCRHRNGPLVVKIFIKPDPGVSLRKFHRRLKSMCSIVTPPLSPDIEHVIKLNGKLSEISQMCTAIRTL